MTSALLFLNKAWLWHVLIIALILMLVFIWKEWQERESKRFWIRLIVALVAISSLAMLALKPVTNKETKSFKAVVITNGYTKEQLDSLEKQHKKIRLISYKVNEPLFNDNDIPDSVFVIGNGIKAFDFWQLDATNVTYLKGTAPKGITRFKYNNEVTLGKQFVFNGVYNKAEKGKTLILKGPGDVDLDSISLKDAILQPFNLKTKVTVSGKFIFSLQEKDSAGTIVSSNPIPVLVKNPKALKVLMLNSFPTFESKYLKNYLAEMGHELLVRSQITTGRFKYEYFNRTRGTLGRLTKKNLSVFDLVVLDGTTLRNLGSATRTEFKNAIKDDGLGFFVQLDNGGLNALKKFSDFSFQADGLNEINSLNDSKISISKLPVSINESLTLSTIHNSNKKIVTALKTLGNGKIGTSVVQNSYELLLRGNTKEYRQFWSKIISAISKKEPKSIEWYTYSKIAYKDHPFEFGLRASNDRLQVLSNNEFNIPLKEDIDIANLWKGITYPNHVGWSALSTKQDPEQKMDYFVTDTTKWKAHNAYQTIVENTQYANKISKTIKQKYTSETISPLWFFLAFICCVTYLWLEPKILG